MKRNAIASLLLYFIIFLTLEKYSYHSAKILEETLNPKIWLSRYMLVGTDEIVQASPEFKTEKDFSFNNLIFKNGSIYTILYAAVDIYKVYFTCEAYYPIRWNMPNPQQFSKIGPYVFTTFGERSSYFNEELDKPVNKKYHLQLEITTSYAMFLSGNFTCESFENETKRESIYLYVEGDQALQFQKENIWVNWTDTVQKVTLPCRPALPNMKVLLFKETESKKYKKANLWTYIPLNESISFHPQVGFTLFAKDLKNSILGTYKCQLLEDDDAFVTIGVKKGTILSSDSYRFKFKHNLIAKYANLTDHKTRIKCCSGTNQPPAVLSFPCENENQCNLLKTIWMYDWMSGKENLHILNNGSGTGVNGDCFKVEVFRACETLICQSSEIDVFAQYVNVFNEEARKRKNCCTLPLVWSAENRHLRKFIRLVFKQ